MAADQGNARAKSNLGVVLKDGTLEEQIEGASLTRQAAEAGRPIAQCNLGILFEEGIGVPVDLEEAMKWFQKSADQGDEGAKRRLAKIVPKVRFLKQQQQQNQKQITIFTTHFFFIFSLKTTTTTTDSIVEGQEGTTLR